MKKHRLFTTFLLILCMTNTWAQEFESIHQLISDTSVQVKVVPIGSISSAAEETNQILREIDQSLIPPDALINIDSALSLIQEKVDSIEEFVKDEYFQKSEYFDVERKKIELEKYKGKLTGNNELIQSEINQLEGEKSKIQQLKQIWGNTISVEWFKEVSEAIRLEINTLNQKVKDTEKELPGAINKYLEVQIKANDQIAQIQELLDKLSIKESEKDKNLLTRTSFPIWKIIRSESINELSKSNFANTIELRRQDITNYYNSNKIQIYYALLYLILVQVFFYYLKYQIRKTEFEKELDRNQNVAVRLLESNWSTGMVLGLLIVFLTLPNKPLVIKVILYYISLFPFYFLFISLIEKNYHFLIKFLFIIFVLTLISDPFLEIVILRRILFFVINLLTLFLLLNLLRKSWYNFSEIKFIAFSTKLISQIFVVLLLISLLTNVWGSFRFTVFATYAIAGSFFYGLLCYLLYLIMLGITTALLYSTPANELRIINKFKVEIEHKISSVLRFVITMIFIILVLRSFKIIEAIFQFFKGIIEYPLNIGNFTFSIWGIFLFVIIILIAKWIANFIVFILDEQILYKTDQKKDLAASVSSLVQFTIIVIGFLIGVVAIGFELDKLTILISAFGVGIGFGLQNIFNNLVSGIIMVFEQPLQVGDVIEVGQLIGEVKKIGIRSSIVRTYDGSEVIVPNGNLISNDLINWTLSDFQRRLIVKVGVAYGTDPEQVIDLLVQVAEKNKGILENPPPYVIFTEFADSSLNFELRCWTDNFDNWLSIISGLRVQVNQELKKAGITIPFPQRDLHIYGTNAGNNSKSNSQKKK